jgi:hypothetical protein
MIDDVSSVSRQANMPLARDLAVQKLRDLTIAIAVAAAAAVGVFAWLSWATLPGSSGASGLTGNATTGTDNQPTFTGDDDFRQAPAARSQPGPAIAVSGGSH